MLLPLAAIAVMLACPLASSATYYVAPDGSDANPGTRELPFATWQKGHDVAVAGDTILIRGGTYAAPHRNIGVKMHERNGTAAAPIKMWAYPGERPVLDCSRLAHDLKIAGVDFAENWWHFKGLIIHGMPQAQNCVTMRVSDASNNIFENMEFCHNAGAGFAISGYSRDNLVRNCDSHHNYDEQTGGDGADGFDLAGTPRSATGNRFEGCRAWWNSDDGFDLWQAEAAVTIDDCWSFWNGYVPGTFKQTPEGDGNGFKLGRNARGPRHRVQRCLAFENLRHGFDDNGATGPQEWYNNTAYRNKQANFVIRGQYPYRLVNSVSYQPGKPDDIAAVVVQDHDSWTLPLTVTDADFLSVDSAGADGSRRPDGSLPELPFLRPSQSSALIGKGVEVGLPYSGSAPDLGAHQAGSTG
jgi:hypothetical protein